jgi:hypothetical protein
MLKVTAPNDWHNPIRNSLTKNGKQEVQVTFKDSMYQSIAITAVPGANIAKISPSSSNETIVQKQVVIDKPEIDTAIEAPDFGDTDFKNNTNELLENIGNMEISVPTVTSKPPQPVNQTTQAKVAQVDVKTPPLPTKPQAQPKPAPVTSPAVVAEQSIDEAKEQLRKLHARTKRVDKFLSYSNINSKDELFINGTVVLVKRFINQGVVLYFWMSESYDPALHKLVEKGSGKYQKDDTATVGEMPEKEQTKQAEKEITPTQLDFVAIDTEVEDQDDLRRDHIRNKRVDYTISAVNLKEGDVLFVQNQTVLVERAITRSQSAFYWLVGDTTINREVERKDDNIFVIK